jgi:anti-sigma factor RsiW
MSCRSIEADLTAYVDGELAGWRAAWIRRHLNRCSVCAGQVRSIERSVAVQRRLLAAYAGAQRVDADEIWGRMRHRLKEPLIAGAPRQRLRWAPSTRLVLAAATACAVAAVFLSRVLDPWLIAVGIEDPPRVLAEKPELFLEYRLFEHLEAIERIDLPEKEERGRRRRGLQRG